MTPDQRFARRVRSAIAAFVLLFVYFLAADLWMPITPQAQLTRPVLRLAPRVSGQVLDIVHWTLFSDGRFYTMTRYGRSLLETSGRVERDLIGHLSLLV
eukprot:gene7583-biopygen6360